MEHCCFCKHPSGNRKQFQRLFGTASNLLCGTITDNISNLLGSRLSLQHAIPQNSIICKDCRLLFVNCDKKQRELRALETRVRSLLEEAFPNLVRRTQLPDVSPVLPRAGQCRPSTTGTSSTPKRLCFERRSTQAAIAITRVTRGSTSKRC